MTIRIKVRSGVAVDGSLGGVIWEPPSAMEFPIIVRDAAPSIKRRGPTNAIEKMLVHRAQGPLASYRYRSTKPAACLSRS